MSVIGRDPMSKYNRSTGGSVDCCELCGTAFEGGVLLWKCTRGCCYYDPCKDVGRVQILDDAWVHTCAAIEHEPPHNRCTCGLSTQSCDEIVAAGFNRPKCEDKHVVDEWRQPIEG